MTQQWTCFHCGQTLVGDRAAMLHFGPPDEQRVPACQLKASDGGLIEAIRRAESDAQDAWAKVHGESAEGVKAYHANLSRHHAALRSAEEAGFERGMSDVTSQFEGARVYLERPCGPNQVAEETFETVLAALEAKQSWASDAERLVIEWVPE